MSSDAQNVVVWLALWAVIADAKAVFLCVMADQNGDVCMAEASAFVCYSCSVSCHLYQVLPPDGSTSCMLHVLNRSGQELANSAGSASSDSC